MLEFFLRDNGFRLVGDTWTRQNLTARGLLDLNIRPLPGDRFDVSLWDGKRQLAAATQGQKTMLETVSMFLTA